MTLRSFSAVLVACGTLAVLGAVTMFVGWQWHTIRCEVCGKVATVHIAKTGDRIASHHVCEEHAAFYSQTPVDRTTPGP